VVEIPLLTLVFMVIGCVDCTAIRKPSWNSFSCIPEPETLNAMFCEVPNGVSASPVEVVWRPRAIYSPSMLFILTMRTVESELEIVSFVASNHINDDITYLLIDLMVSITIHDRRSVESLATKVLSVLMPFCCINCWFIGSSI